MFVSCQPVTTIVDQLTSTDDSSIRPAWVAEQLKESIDVWQFFQQFPYFYQRLKIGWIIEASS